TSQPSSRPRARRYRSRHRRRSLPILQHHVSRCADGGLPRPAQTTRCRADRRGVATDFRQYPGNMRFLLALVLASAAMGAKVPPKAAPKPKTAPLTADQGGAQALMKSMTLRDKVAQLVIVVTNGDALSTRSPEYTRYKRLIGELHIGGLIVNN